MKKLGAATKRAGASVFHIVPTPALGTSDLFVDAEFQGGRKGNAGDDPLSQLLSVSNQGGFRYRGNLDLLEMVVLTSSFNDPDWPDALDRQTGILTYFGDNKRPGSALHQTPRNGNRILRKLFEMAHSKSNERLQMPPILTFANSGTYRDLVFLGLAVPGNPDLAPFEDLVAIWKTSSERRFQNYRAHLTILNVPTVSRAWINDILQKRPRSANAPDAWMEWIETGRYRPLFSEQPTEYRTRKEQLPESDKSTEVIKTIHSYFANHPVSFENCAASLARLMLHGVASLDVTRPSRDGGRDAIGKLRIGSGRSAILSDFALEAKCYAISQPVGVRELSRLISRLRHRQFGVFVTTSYVHLQAYKEIKEDQHPIVVISARDIVELLKAIGVTDANATREWLSREFPIGGPEIV
jgi:hypothetical protein